MTAATHTSQCVSFDAGGGHVENRAVLPPSIVPADPTRLATCALLWSKGATSARVAGIESVEWSVARPGREMFPALTLAANSGAYAIYTQAC